MLNFHIFNEDWIPAPCFTKAKPLWLRGGECAGMSGDVDRGERGLYKARVT